ncbi:MAG: hypothetical protein Kow00104_19300 [Rhodothalassiaceae bacterium]
MTATSRTLLTGATICGLGLGLGLGLAACATAAEPPAPPAPKAAPEPGEAPAAAPAPRAEIRRSFRIERRDDGNRIVIVEMDAIGDEVREAVARARDEAETMREQALEHIDKALMSANRMVIDLDGRSLVAIDRLKDVELRIRHAFDFAWTDGLTAELEELEREITELGKEIEGTEVLDEAELEALRAEREQALAEAERELEKAEKIRRQALAQAADQLRMAREQLRRQRDQLRQQIESDKSGKKEKNDP